MRVQPTRGGGNNGIALLFALAIVGAAIAYVYRMVSAGQYLSLAVEILLLATIILFISVLVRINGVSRI